MYNIGQVQNSLDRITQNTDTVNFKNGQKNMGNSKLTSDGFMQLMLAQLKLQDPTNPVSDKEFVQQQAALSQIESLDQLSVTLKETSNLSQASGLAGKYVTVKGGDGQETTGKVNQISFGNGSIGLQVNNQFYTTDQVRAIYDGAPVVTPPATTPVTTP
jgi:flagellar basal-body rod modification protein FlgD